MWRIRGEPAGDRRSLRAARHGRGAPAAVAPPVAPPAAPPAAPVASPVTAVAPPAAPPVTAAAPPGSLIVTAVTPSRSRSCIAIDDASSTVVSTLTCGPASIVAHAATPHSRRPRTFSSSASVAGRQYTTGGRAVI